MYGIGNKKMLNMFILEILRNYTDENHSLTQQEIIKLLEKDYGTVCDRRSVKNNVLLLKEFGESHGFEISMEDGTVHGGCRADMGCVPTFFCRDAFLQY